MHLNKKTKIVCTIGPVTESEAQLAKLLKVGMNVARLNFSHGDFAEHQHKVDNLKKAIKKTGITAAILQDLSGPKFRIGEFYKDRVDLKEGDFITLTQEKIVGDEKRVSINVPNFHKSVKVGSFIMVDDGKKKFEVVEIKGKDVKCKIIRGGDTKGRRGVNLPGASLKLSSLTEKDKKDLEFGIKNEVDFVAFSFVRTRENVLELRDLLNKAKSKALIVSKIETQEAVDNIDGIIEASDAIMVARGDLAVEIGAENVPLFQKTLIKKCNELGKPVITATQMLESMIKVSVPTRAEVSDVANAILDGTDAIMLSEETTLGDFPIEAVEVMTRIALRVENDLLHRQLLINGKDSGEYGIGESICSSAVKIADRVDAKYLVSLTTTGKGARLMARHRGPKAILVFTPNETTYRQMNLLFGCYPQMIKHFKDYDDAMNSIAKTIEKEKLVKKGDKVVVVSGVPFGKAPQPNVLFVHTI